MPQKQLARRPRAVSRVDRDRFLSGVAEGLTVKDAAELTGHPRSTFYALRDRDEKFAAQFKDAIEDGTDTLETEAYRRAVLGWDEEVYGKGPQGHVVQVGTVHKYSDNLLITLLKGRRPQYKDNPRIDLTQQTSVIAPDDRSAPIIEVFKVLRDAGALDAVVEGGAIELPATTETET